MILLIDNYDSFVFNLERYFQRLGQPTVVVRSDEVELERIAAGQYSAIVISPGPKAPEQAGKSLEVVERFHAQVPLLGVCLGHQVICQAFGAKIVRAPRAVHGQSSAVEHQHSRLFAGLPNPFYAARYHSLIADRATLPAELRITGTTATTSGNRPGAAAAESIVMAVEHTRWPVFGVQFHPESILSVVGYRILANFLELAGLPSRADLPELDFASNQVWDQFHQGPPASTPLAALDEASQWPPTVLPSAAVRPLEQPEP
jgi:anthranilate synthase/aminodeoxychorismate synthase-like glutamine amidotransferase